MAFKIVLLFAVIAAATAQYHHQNSHGHQILGHGYNGHDDGHHEEHYGPAEYEFSYSVHDEKHGDIKHQKETRHGDQVQGEYSLIEPDGHRRTVKYSSDKHTGFVAEVHREEVHGYKAPVQASYHHGGESHGYVHKVAVAPVQVATISHGHSSGGHGSSYGSQGHSHIVAAAPIYKKVAVAAPVYVSHGHLGGHSLGGSSHSQTYQSAPAHFSGSSHGSSYYHH